ncbi:MAG: thioesterase family protein [Pseudomonadota bacterium]
MPFTMDQPVLFRHCDPARIVFFPRYFEMLNDVTEAFFAEIGAPWQVLHKDHAVPTVALNTHFAAPSTHGDVLTFLQSLTRLGRTSITLLTTATCKDETRLTSEATLVHVNLSGRPEPWPDELARALRTRLEPAP